MAGEGRRRSPDSKARRFTGGQRGGHALSRRPLLLSLADTGLGRHRLRHPVSTGPAGSAHHHGWHIDDATWDAGTADLRLLQCGWGSGGTP
ncbi:hypothetical protein [Actinoalloteichus fjordicus]|uniref:hypothetical protein n=1 Tax=Actinoalloteichus fjordicus TaxID=1612552 RepID=UPI0012F7D54C|nr:hypothetical protein [Actinoalloteichus fjordicus]